MIGPYSQVYVEDGLRSREIVALDEVMSPLGRWRYMIDEPVFAKLAQSMKDSRNDNEHTMTSTMGDELDENTNNVIDLTDTVDISPFSQQRGGARREIPQPPNPGRREQDVKSYGFSEDKNIEKEAGGRSFFVWGSFVLVLVLAGMLIFRGLTTGQSGSNSLVEKGKVALELGEYEKSIDFFVRALKIDSKNVEAILSLSPLVAQIERKYELGRQLLSLLEDHQAQSKEVFAIRALLALFEEKLDEADRYLDRSLALDGRYLPALVNKMNVRFRKKDFAGVDQVFSKIEKDGGVDGLAALISIRSMIARLDQTGSFEFQDKAMQLIDRYLKKGRNFRQEMLLLKSYVEVTTNKESGGGSQRAFLNTDPYMTENHWQHLHVDTRLGSWNSLLPYCQKISETAQSAISAAVHGMCLVKAQKYVEADKVISIAIQKQPKDLLVASVKAYLITITEGEDKGRALANHIVQKESHDLSLYLSSHHCDRGEEGCSSASWRVLLDRNSADISAIAGLAEQAAAESRTEDARHLAQKGLQLSPGYFPLRRIMWNIENEKK